MSRKRERSENFTREETDILIMLVAEHKDIIENKKSNTNVWNAKDNCWKDIEILFNSTSGRIIRTAKTLKIKYDTIKRDIRRKSARALSDGPSDSTKLTPIEEKVKNIVLTAADGSGSGDESDSRRDVESGDTLDEGSLIRCQSADENEYEDPPRRASIMTISIQSLEQDPLGINVAASGDESDSMQDSMGDDEPLSPRTREPKQEPLDSSEEKEINDEMRNDDKPHKLKPTYYIITRNNPNNQQPKDALGAKKRRGVNWSQEEKNILRHLICASYHIIENKSTSTESNLHKAREWRSITKKFNELTNSSRRDYEVRFAWKRMKLAPKSKLPVYRKRTIATRGGSKQPAKQEDVQIVEQNLCDSDGAPHLPNSKCIEPNESKKTDKRQKEKSNSNMKNEIVETNNNLKNRQLEMLEEMHVFNKKIAQLKIRKLELEIAQILRNN